MNDFEAHDLTPLIGSEIFIGRDALLHGGHAAHLRRLLVERGVIAIRDLPLTPQEQRTITATLGPLAGDGGAGVMHKVTIDRTVSPEYAAHFANTLFWHMDGYHDQTVPCFGGSFRPEHIAGDGGETEFLNAYAAYDSLDAADRALVDRLWVIHTALTSGLTAIPDADDEQIAAWRKRPRARQPLVWEHASGRKSLMLGVAVSHVIGMHPADSHDLLCRLRVHMARPEHVYRHAWRRDDLVIWNNTGTLHRARPFDPLSGRLLHRFTIEGDEPIRATPAAQHAG